MDKQFIKQRLDQIKDRNNGLLEPDHVVDDSRRDKNSPLHGMFDWNIESAARKHWIDTARAIIASVYVVVRTEKVEIKVPCYVRDVSRPSREQGYVSVESLRSDEDLSRATLIAEFTRVGDLLRRARGLAVALNVSDDVDRMITDIVGLREQLEHSAAPQ